VPSFFDTLAGMEPVYVSDEKREQTDYTQEPLPAGDYEQCHFTGCNFAGTNLSQINFIDCIFEGCNLSAAQIVQTAFRDVRFDNCKLLGLQFSDCNHFLFAASFAHCTMNLTGFYKVKLKDFNFSHCILQEADFTEADCSGVVFDNCNLERALFENTNLEKADLRTAFHYSIDPGRNRIRKAKFSLEGVAGLLDQYDIIIE
jgi:uncharacterized protein YjbI with pentapeptide repeats